jgi:hypothetical protein
MRVNSLSFVAGLKKMLLKRFELCHGSKRNWSDWSAEGIIHSRLSGTVSGTPRSKFGRFFVEEDDRIVVVTVYVYYF